MCEYTDFSVGKTPPSALQRSMEGASSSKSPAVEEELSKTALISGITGQDGAHLAELLLEKGHFHGDRWHSTNLIRIIQEVRPDEIHNLAAQSHVAVSFETPEYTANSDETFISRKITRATPPRTS
jgi:hypothetical protein